MVEPLTIGCLYRSPNSSNENNDNMCKLLEEMPNITKQPFVMGDFNLPKIDWSICTSLTEKNSKEAQFLECLQDCFLHQKCDKPTRIRVN